MPSAERCGINDSFIKLACSRTSLASFSILSGFIYFSLNLLGPGNCLQMRNQMVSFDGKNFLFHPKSYVISRPSTEQPASKKALRMFI